MGIFLSLIAIISAILLGAMSPGPSFILVVRTAAANSRKAALATAFGMGLGGAVFATAAVLGLQIMLATVPMLYLAVKVAGAAYLLYLAFRLWKGAGDPLPIPAETDAGKRSWRKSLTLGLVTQLSNPKTAIVYASIFTAFLSADRPAWFAVILIPAVFTVEFGWYAMVALAFSLELPRRNYLRFKRWIDRAAGVVMGLLAIKLVASAR